MDNTHNTLRFTLLFVPVAVPFRFLYLLKLLFEHDLFCVLFAYSKVRERFITRIINTFDLEMGNRSVVSRKTCTPVGTRYPPPAWYRTGEMNKGGFHWPL